MQLALLQSIDVSLKALAATCSATTTQLAAIQKAGEEGAAWVAAEYGGFCDRIEPLLQLAEQFDTSGGGGGDLAAAMSMLSGVLPAAKPAPAGG